MNSQRLLCVVAAVGFSMCAVSNAAVVYTEIPGVFGTGLDDIGHGLPVGSVDPHYTITSSPIGATSAAAADVYFMWTANTSSSGWIKAQGFGSGSAVPGDYVYTTTFSLDGFDPSSAIIVGEWASDNTSTIYLNGVNTGMSHGTPFEFAYFQYFVLKEGFVPGMNTISFVVNQAPHDAYNPDGLQVRIITALAVVPEPSSLALCGLGAAAFVVTRRKRQ